MLLTACTQDFQTDPVTSTSPTSTSPAGYTDPDSLSPTTPQQTLTFLFFSDTQPDPELNDFTGVGGLLKQAVEHYTKPELIIFGGDTVNDGRDEAQWYEFWDAAGSSLDDLITAAVSGNHDNDALLANQFDYPFEAPIRADEGFFYTFTVGQVCFIMLDSNIMGAANPRDIEWLQNTLQSDIARNASWRIAVMHHPMWPVVDNPKDAQRAAIMREHFLPVLEKYNVDMILCGHQHVYTRTKPMLGDSAAENIFGIVQIMVASGDKESYTIGERDFISASDTAPNYVLLIADSKSISGIVYNGENMVIDRFTIYK